MPTYSQLIVDKCLKL